MKAELKLRPGTNPVGQQLNGVSEWQRGYNDACELMACGHPRACLKGVTCQACKRTAQLLAAADGEEPDGERERLLAIVRRAAASVVPKSTTDFIDGAQAAAEIIVRAIEEAS